MTPEGVFDRPTSVIVFGSDRPLLDWVAFVLASSNDPEFVWTDVRFPGQDPGKEDPMTRAVIPPERLTVRRPSELTLNDQSANVAVSAVIRSDEPPEDLRRLVDFLRLPTPTQQVLSGPRSSRRRSVVVLSNAHRLAALYPGAETVARTVRTILESDTVLVMTFADAPSDARFGFETILHVDGSLRDGWRRATLRVERAASDGPFRAGTQAPLGELPPFASVLARELG